MTEPDDDPARGFLDQTVPRHDEWSGREPEEGPARPRHVQYPTEPVEPLTAKERRANTIRSAAWGVGSLGAFAAGAALSDDDGDGGGQLSRPEPEADYGDVADYSGYGEAGSGY
jgi:hypothetical protein